MSAYKITRRAVVFGAFPAACGMAATSVRTLPSLAALRQASVAGLSHGAQVHVTQAGVGGRFRWDAHSAVPDDDLFVFAPVGVPRGRWMRDTSRGLDAGWFGASPQASAEVNTAAFVDASQAINRAGGGTLRIPPGTYRVGVQRRGGRFGPNATMPGETLIKIENCRNPVAILGPGAVLKAADGVRFGSFDPRTGAPHQPKVPFYDPAFAASAGVMIHVRHCAGPVRIEGLVLDGNRRKYQLGGQWGDTGRQLGGDGIVSERNTGGVLIADVRCYDHGRDGIMIGHGDLGPRSPRFPVTLTNVHCDLNGRQGVSWVGGTQLTATRCRFTRTGRGQFISAPGAGFDIEAEGSVCRNGHFIECEFSDNVGVGMLADSGDSADMLFERCKFIGTTMWSAWPRKPGFVFRDCLFVGSIVQCHADADPRRATQFYNCRFIGDPALSPTGAVYGAYLADLGAGATNVLMSGCEFRAVSPHIVLPWTPADVRFHNCTFSQRSGGVSYPRGVFTGTNTITSPGNVELWGSKFLGKLTLNGRLIT